MRSDQELLMVLRWKINCDRDQIEDAIDKTEGAIDQKSRSD